MIKEKDEKGPEAVKEEPGGSDKEPPNPDVRVKKEEDPTGSSCAVKKEPGRPVTKNGGIIGSTNAGSLLTAERKCESEEGTGGDSAPLTLKTEECIEGDLAGDAFGLDVPGRPGEYPKGLVTGAPPLPAPPDGVQPLASNVINKQPSSIEVQYMQQQSQIFVFSTLLANTGAEEVLQGRYPSIIAYHCAQPGTKKYLEKNPLKMTQFSRQNAQWLSSLSMMKGGKCSKGQPPIDSFEALDEMVGLGDGDLPWDQKNNHHLEGLEGVSNGLPEVENMQPSLQGVKVPDENLTPQQRQHREEQLATIRKMQQMLFPENQSEGGEPGGGGLEPIAAQMEWQKLQHQFFETKGGGGKPVPRAAGPPGPRLQGPPPPYHQTPRSASVPIALQSPSPASPNNPTSNLSLPSPRASSAMNSPADPGRTFAMGRHVGAGQSPTSQDSPTAQRLNHSNPGTPVSSHLSPSVGCNTTEAGATHQSTDGMFGRTLQSMAQQKQQMSSTPTTTASAGVKEPNLMPVPSPQQIQYLNTFEGQELIIQKQPNTSLKEGNIMSSPVLPTTMESGFPGNAELPHSRVSCPNTPTSVDVGPRFPVTPGVPSEGCRFQIPSPHTPTATGEKTPRLPGPPQAPGLSPQTGPGPTSDPLKTDLFPTSSPHMMDVPRFPGGPNASPGSKMPGGGFVNVSPSSAKPLDLPNYGGCARGDNVPLNPNCTGAMGGNPKVSHFDPISSLAQMSQQLTNSVANGQGGQGPAGMMNFGSPSMHMIEMGACHGMPPEMEQGPTGMMGMAMPQGHPHGFQPMGPIRSLSPKLPGAFPMPRMMGRPPGPPNPYNGANVQVKPNAPNTIQYLPAKSVQGVGAPGPPRGPPSLDFLQRFTNPLGVGGGGGGGGGMEPKMQNVQYFPGGNGPMHMGHMDGGPGMPPDGPMGPMMGMPPMMRGGPMRPPPNMMRMPHQMGFNPNGGGPDHPAMFGGPGAAQMFVGGPKGSPMGAPEAAQPLPPSMGQNSTFKGSPFVGPTTTTDPNYAQQYHNFQQQLYATGTRSQMGGGQAMGPGPGPGPPHNQQQAYFNPK